MGQKTSRTTSIGSVAKGIVKDKSLHVAPTITRIHYDVGFNNSCMERLKEIGENIITMGEIGYSGPKKFIVNNYNRKIYEQMIKYIQGDEKCTWDIKKAVGFIGSTGIGKSLSFQMMLEFMGIDNIQYLKNGKQLNFKFKIYSARQIVSDFSTSGFDGIEKYIIPNIICIDDLGTENENAQHFGNKVNVIEQIFEERYLYKKLTHFSSNFDINDIGKKYGDRVKSRIIETTNLVEWIGEDWRTKQK